MATRSFVGRELENRPDTVEYIYIHFDGDLVGATLNNYYADPRKVDALMSNGNLSYLDASLKDSKSYGERSSQMSAKDFTHSKQRSIVDYVYLWDSGNEIWIDV